MSDTVGERLPKMLETAAGALRTIDEREQAQLLPAESRQKAWWEGYRQAAEELAACDGVRPTVTKVV